MEDIIEENTINDNLNSEPDNQNKRSKVGVVLNVILTILLIILAVRLIFGIFYGGIYVVGDSMMPNFYGAASEEAKGGDYVFVNKFAVPERGDVVVILIEEDGEEKAIIKRVIGLPGDELYLDKGELYIKYTNSDEFVLIKEDYIDEQYNDPDLRRNTTNETIVPENCMYVLGDNRNISQDSRYEGYGCFSMDDLLGVVTEWSINFKEPISNIYNFFKF